MAQGEPDFFDVLWFPGFVLGMMGNLGIAGVGQAEIPVLGITLSEPLFTLGFQKYQAGVEALRTHSRTRQGSGFRSTKLVLKHVQALFQYIKNSGFQKYQAGVEASRISRMGWVRSASFRSTKLVLKQPRGDASPRGTRVSEVPSWC